MILQPCFYFNVYLRKWVIKIISLTHYLENSSFCFDIDIIISEKETLELNELLNNGLITHERQVYCFVQPDVVTGSCQL